VADGLSGQHTDADTVHVWRQLPDCMGSDADMEQCRRADIRCDGGTARTRLLADVLDDDDD